jgi:hypothetical protein
MTTICGHDLNVVRTKLALWIETPDVAHAMAFAAWENHAMRGDNYSEAEWQVARDLTDPEKLAALLASKATRLGFDVWLDRPGTRFFTDPPNDAQLAIYWTSCAVEVYMPSIAEPYILALPQVRALLLKWLAMPNGAKDNALRALRGDT